MNIYLDIDDVVAAWQEAYCKKFNKKPAKSWDENREEMNSHLQLLKRDKSFWVTLPIKYRPNFRPKGYLSARSIPKAWTYQFMCINQLPGRRNINQVPWNVSKIKKLKELNCDIFIDDKIETFEECNKNGIFCLLMDASHNQNYKTPYRINNLDIENIMQLWRKLR